MIGTRQEIASAPAPAMAQLGQRLLVVIALVSAAILAAWLWMAWEQTRSAQLARMNITVKLLAAHADHYFASLGNRLEILANDLDDVDPLRHPRAALPLLKVFKAGNLDLIGASLIRPDGQMLVSTLRSANGSFPNVLSDPEWRADFEQSLKAPGLFIGRPQMGHLVKEVLIHLRYAVRDKQGRTRYLIQSGITLVRQQELWRNLGLNEGAGLGLLREDGFLISRIPGITSVDVYRKPVLGGALYRATRDQPQAGGYEGLVVDGSYRLGVYQRLAQQPLYAFLSHPRSTFVALWWEQVRLPLMLAAGFLVAATLMYGWLSRHYSGRMRVIEVSLASSGQKRSADFPSSGVREIDTLVAALVQSREQLRQTAHAREKRLLSAAAAGTYSVRARDGVLLTADAPLLQMLGRHEHEVVGRPWSEFVSAQDNETSGNGAGVVRVLTGPSPRWLSLAEYQGTLADGEPVRNGLAIDVTDRELLLSRVNTQSQRLGALWQLATTRDTSDAEKMLRMLRLSLDTLHMDAVLVSELCVDQLVVRNLVDTLQLFHLGQEIAIDSALCRYAVEGQKTLIIPDLHADPGLSVHEFAAELKLRAFVSVPIWVGQSLFGTLVFVRRTPLDEDFNADDRAFLELLAAWFGKILFEQQQHEKLESMAMTDMLTQLINRRAAEARFIEEFARARRAGDVFSVAVCDLDRFKLVNDHYGHDTGDEVLRHVAGIMKAELREGDWVARWGGEEFIIFLYRSDAPTAHAVMERLRLTIKGNPASTAHGPLDITTSIGIGTFRGEEDLAAVLSEADGCLYEAKRAGRDHVVVGDSSMRGTLWRAGMLQHALIENRLVPAYQVMVDLRTNKVVADESLARLIEPDGRIVSAGEFIEAAEGINLIHVVDEVISRQCMQRCALKLSSGKDKPGLTHFINLSPQFLARRDLVQAMLHQAARHCVECGMVDAPIKPMVLEVTERQLIGNFKDLLSDLQPLLDFGFRLALDDFGSGYSSFLYLASLPVSFLKIEGWMVQNLRTNPKVLGMVKSIIALARDQGITTIAECVEDAATADLLRELGVDWGQGWYFGRPECEIEPAQVLKAARPGA